MPKLYAKSNESILKIEECPVCHNKAVMIQEPETLLWKCFCPSPVCPNEKVASEKTPRKAVKRWNSINGKDEENEVPYITVEEILTLTEHYNCVIIDESTGSKRVVGYEGVKNVFHYPVVKLIPDNRGILFIYCNANATGTLNLLSLFDDESDYEIRGLKNHQLDKVLQCSLIWVEESKAILQVFE